MNEQPPSKLKQSSWTPGRVREWIVLGMGVAAGVVFLYLCLQPQPDRSLGA